MGAGRGKTRRARSSSPPTTPVEVDTQLATLYNELVKLEDKHILNEATLKSIAGAKFYYRGNRRVTDMELPEAIEKIEAGIAKGEYFMPGGSWTREQAESALRRRNEQTERMEQLKKEMEALEKVYHANPWSRFFLVTSSQGHIHSSMRCHTCRLSTRYGWLPELSGKTEAEAVEAYGPTLCSECFKSAPVEWTGTKIKKAAANAAAYH